MAQSYLVVGGCGLVGWNIVKALLARGEQAVAVFDLVQREHDERVQFFTGDICDQSAVENALKRSGATVVFHTATPVPAPQTPKALYWKVNVEGTRSVISACAACGVVALVYTSSASVVFDGSDVMDLDERAPYAANPADEYSATKIEGEKLVLAASGNGVLKTCSLRPAAIFGPGDRLLIPGMVKVLKEGKYRFQLGDNRNLWDYTYVDNCVKAHLIAADKLVVEGVPEVDIETPLPSVKLTIPSHPIPSSDPSLPHTAATVVRSRYDQYSPQALEEAAASSGPNDSNPLAVAGQAFFITNGEPLNFWSFTRAVWAAYGDGYDSSARIFALSQAVSLYIGQVGDIIQWVTGKPPTIDTFRAKSVTAHRWYNIEKARRVLGYEPDVGTEEGIRRSIAWYKQNEQRFQK